MAREVVSDGIRPLTRSLTDDVTQQIAGENELLRLLESGIDFRLMENGQDRRRVTPG